MCRAHAMTSLQQDGLCWLQGHTWCPQSAADRALGNQLRATLALIHEQGVLHNDLKSENIMVHEGTGRPVILDFAIASQPADQYDFDNEKSELHAMLGQADPGYQVRCSSSQSLMHAHQAFVQRVLTMPCKCEVTSVSPCLQGHASLAIVCWDCPARYRQVPDCWNMRKSSLRCLTLLPSVQTNVQNN